MDMKTIFFSLIIGHLFTALLVGTYWSRQINDHTVKIFLYAKCAQAAAWLLLVIRGGIRDFMTLGLSNSLLFIGVGLEIAAILSLHNWLNRKSKLLCISITAVNVVGFFIVIRFFDVESIRISFASVGNAAIIVVAAFRMLAERKSTLLLKTMGGFYSIICVFFVVRAAASLFSELPVSFFERGMMQSVSFILLYVVMIAGNMGFVLLMKERADRQLLRYANYDDLTGTLNRRSFQSLASRQLALLSRRREPVSMIVFDVDQFKAINDTYGHDAGDQVLQHITASIKSRLGERDLFARYGGDEFCIFLPGKDEAEAVGLAEEIRSMIAGSVNEPPSYACTISLGVLTVIPDSNTKLEALHSSCDKALYGAKKKGRNNVFRTTLGAEGSAEEGFLPL